MRVTVTRDMLLNHSHGWISQWAGELESQRCIAPGSAQKLAEQISEALPLELNRAFHLLYTDQLEIIPQMRLQVVSPILRAGALASNVTPVAGEASQQGNRVDLTFKSSSHLLGFETAIYRVEARTDGDGLEILPVQAVRRLGDVSETRPAPAVNYFNFAGARFYRVFYEAEQNEYAALIVAAATRTDLERRTQRLTSGAASCAALNDDLCIAVPKQVAINGLVPVIANGAQIWVNWASNAGAALRAAGLRNAEASLAKLRVQKGYRGKLVDVEFDPASSTILNMIVAGGEVLTLH